MNGLCGWSGPEAPEADARERLLRMFAPLIRPGRPDPEHAVAAKAALAVGGVRRPASIARLRGRLAAVVGRPRFLDPALDARIDAEGVARVVLERVLEDGPAAIERLHGGFALAVVSENGDEALLAIDRVGGRYRLAYRAAAAGLLFGTRSDCVTRHPDGSADLDPQAIFDYLYFNVVPAPASAWQGVRYLPAGHLLLYRDGRAVVRPYWNASYREDARPDLEALSAEFRECLRRAVERGCRGDGTLGSFLSGGIDSSTLAGLVRDVTGEPARTFSIGFDAEGFDEMAYARIAVERFGSLQHERYVRPEDVLAILPEIATSYAEPFGNASAVPVHCCARLAREHGIERMFGGDGGDELFAGNKRYATQRLFGYYGSIPEALRRGLLEPFAERGAWLDVFPPARKVRRYVEQARVPMPDRLETYNQLEVHGVATVLDPDFLARVDPGRPRTVQREAYDGADATDMLDRMLALDMKLTIEDSDLPKVTVMSELAGVDVEYPFLDDEVVAFSHRVPARWKMRGRRLRWFVKHALADYLPREILEKEKHGFGLPFGVWLRDHPGLREFARDHLASLRGRGVVRPAFVDDLVRRHASEHATYYGVMIWVLLVLELWFRENRGSGGP